MALCATQSGFTIGGNPLVLINVNEEFPNCTELVLYAPGESTLLPPLSLEDGALISAAIVLALTAAFGFRVLFKMRITSD